MSAYDYISEVGRTHDILTQGGSILYPTDTIWGLGCDATDDEAIDKIFAIKQRPTNKSCIILFPTLKEALKYTANPPDVIYNAVEEYKDYPTTFIIDNAIGLGHGAVNADGSMAFRIPQHRFCIQLLKKFGKPILSTSANISGEPAPQSFSDIDDKIKNSVDYIVDRDMPDNSTHLPSRIIRLFSDNTTRVLR